MLTGGDAKDAQKEALQKFQEVIDGMSIENPTFGKSQQDALHAYGDSFAHAKKDGKMYSSPFGHALDSVIDWVRGLFGLPPKYDPDNPYTDPGKFEAYLGGLYDNLAKKAQEGGYSPKMTRDEFIRSGTAAAAGTHKEKEQESNMQGLIENLERR